MDAIVRLTVFWGRFDKIFPYKNYENLRHTNTNKHDETIKKTFSINNKS